MRNVLITGATGFFGVRLVRKLVHEGCEVTVLTRDRERARKLIGDDARIVDYDASLGIVSAADALSDRTFDVFYSLAWAGVSTTEKNEYSEQLASIRVCLDVCDLAARIGCRHIIMPGTASEYASSDGIVDGKGAPAPVDGYSAAKVAAYYLCDMYARQHGCSLTWLLIPGVYGPGREDANVITYAIRTFLAGGRPSFTKLEQRWDYLYVDDMMEVLYLAGQKGVPGKLYPVGSGEVHPLSEVMEMIRDDIDPNLPMGIGEVPYKTSHIDDAIVDISEFQRDTGFLAKIPMREGIVRTIDYFKAKQAGCCL